MIPFAWFETVQLILKKSLQIQTGYMNYSYLVVKFIRPVWLPFGNTLGKRLVQNVNLDLDRVLFLLIHYPLIQSQLFPVLFLLLLTHLIFQFSYLCLSNDYCLQLLRQVFIAKIVQVLEQHAAYRHTTGNNSSLSCLSTKPIHGSCP